MRLGRPLRIIGLRLRAAKTVALVGDSGSGKIFRARIRQPPRHPAPLDRRNLWLPAPFEVYRIDEVADKREIDAAVRARAATGAHSSPLPLEIVRKRGLRRSPLLACAAPSTWTAASSPRRRRAGTEASSSRRRHNTRWQPIASRNTCRGPPYFACEALKDAEIRKRI